MHNSRPRVFILLLLVGCALFLARPLPAPIFESFPGVHELVERASVVAVWESEGRFRSKEYLEYLEQKKATPGHYDPRWGTYSGGHQLHEGKILSVLKGDAPTTGTVYSVDAGIGPQVKFEEGGIYPAGTRLLAFFRKDPAWTKSRTGTEPPVLESLNCVGGVMLLCPETDFAKLDKANPRQAVEELLRRDAETRKKKNLPPTPVAGADLNDGLLRQPYVTTTPPPRSAPPATH